MLGREIRLCLALVAITVVSVVSARPNGEMKRSIDHRCDVLYPASLNLVRAVEALRGAERNLLFRDFLLPDSNPANLRSSVCTMAAISTREEFADFYALSTNNIDVVYPQWVSTVNVLRQQIPRAVSSPYLSGAVKRALTATSSFIDAMQRTGLLSLP